MMAREVYDIRVRFSTHPDEDDVNAIYDAVWDAVTDFGVAVEDPILAREECDRDGYPIARVLVRW